MAAVGEDQPSYGRMIAGGGFALVGEVLGAIETAACDVPWFVVAAVSDDGGCASHRGDLSHAQGWSLGIATMRGCRWALKLWRSCAMLTRFVYLVALMRTGTIVDSTSVGARLCYSF